MHEIVSQARKIESLQALVREQGKKIEHLEHIIELQRQSGDETTATGTDHETGQDPDVAEDDLDLDNI